MKKILFNIASRERPKELYKTMTSILSNINDIANCRFLFKLDKDDPELSEYMSYIPSYDDLIFGKGVVSIRIGNSKSKIEAINADIPKDGWDILVNVSDDQIFIERGFDDVIRKYHEPFKFLHFPDSYKKAACSVMSIMDINYYKEFGYVYNPNYYSLWCDVEATEVAKLMNAYKYVPKTIFLHSHYSNTGREKDALYVRNNTYKEDKYVYLHRREANFGLPIPKDDFLLIKYATRGRWRLFFAAIDNIYATIHRSQFKILVSADEDDVEMNSGEVREFCKRYHNVELHYRNNKSKIEAINANMNPATDWKWSVVMSDDMEFTRPGWDKCIEKDIDLTWGNNNTDWFAHFNDGYVGDKLPTLNVCGRQYYDRFGYFYHPAYKSVSCDAENMFVAMMLGKYKYFDEVYFNHMHPANTKEPSDYIYRRNHEWGDGDTAVYFQRLKNKFFIENPLIIPEQMIPFL